MTKIEGQKRKFHPFEKKDFYGQMLFKIKNKNKHKIHTVIVLLELNVSLQFLGLYKRKDYNTKTACHINYYQSKSFNYHKCLQLHC